MTSRKFSYFEPASFSPLSATRKPTTPKTTATTARLARTGSLIPKVVKLSAPE